MGVLLQALRTEPKVARLLLRRLIRPLELYDESTRPDFIKADTTLKTGLMDKAGGLTSALK
jgi:hypothetical protein